MTFGDYRRSRYLSQSETAALLNVSVGAVKRMDLRPINDEIFTTINDLEVMLISGPHACVKRRYLDPLTMKSMTSREARRLPVGRFFGIYGYVELDPAQDAALRMRRPDLSMKLKNWYDQRVLVMYRVIVSRYQREALRKGFGTMMVEVRLPSLTPVQAFQQEEAA